MAVAEAFPLDAHLEMWVVLNRIARERRAIAEGHNPKFERAVSDLAPLGIPREELIRRTTFFFLPAYQWARDQSAWIDSVRPPVTKLQHQLRKMKQRLPSPAFTAAILAKLDALLDYLAAIPTKEAAKKWRRTIGLNRRHDLGKLREWTRIAVNLERYLKAKDVEAYRRSNTFAVRAAHTLLHARYPGDVPTDWRKLLHRVRR